jgi:hypothetical protein
MYFLPLLCVPFVPPGDLLGICDFISQLKKLFKNVHHHPNRQKYSNIFQNIFCLFAGYIQFQPMCATFPPRQINPFLNMDSSSYSSVASPSSVGCLLSAPTVKVSIVSCLFFDGSFDSGKYMQYATARSSRRWWSILMA